MAASPASRGQSLQFGAFELRVEEGQLLKHGVRIRLQEQPLTLLTCLLQNPGTVVPREELSRRIWADGTFVDYEHGLNATVTRLRQALGDTAEAPRYVETIPRRGYRFIAPVTFVGSPKLDGSRPTQLETPAVRKPRRLRVAMTACGACLVAALAAGLWLRSPWEGRAVQLTPFPLTAAPGFEYQPDFSPDGAQVVYSWAESKSNANHIFVKLIGSGKPLELTSGPGADFVPAWSPDGRTIAFVRVLDQRTAIYVVPPLGGAERKVADVRFAGGKLSWSPDGRFLVLGECTGMGASQSIYRIGTENGERFRLTQSPDLTTQDWNPVFRPTGRDVLFTRCAKLFDCGLYIQELSKDYRPVAKPLILKEESGSIAGAAWTTSGEEVVYALSDNAGLNHRLKKIRVSNKASTEQLTYAGEHLLFPAIARIGSRLADTQDLSDLDILQVEIGKQPRSFASSTRFEYAAQYSPDGKHVVFSSDRSGQMEIWICEADGENPIQLTHLKNIPARQDGRLTAGGSRSIAMQRRAGTSL